MSSFIENCLANRAVPDDIDDYIDEWHEGKGEIPLYQYLGMNQSEYSRWVINPGILPAILADHRREQSMEDLLA